MPNLRAKSTLWHAFPCKIVWLSTCRNFGSLFHGAMAAASFSFCGAVQINHGGAVIHLNRVPNPASPPMQRLFADGCWQRRSRESSCHPRRQDLHVEQATNMLKPSGYVFSRASPQPKHMWSKSLKVHCFPASVPVRPLYTPSGNFCLFPSLSLARVIFFNKGYFDGTSWQVWPFPRLIL